MDTLQVIERIEKDCQEKGHGRKKWWAEILGIHQQTLSYWLHAHRRPRGQRVQQMNDLLSIMNKNSEIEIWRDYLLDIYLGDREINKTIVVEAINKIMSSEVVDSRTLGFLSFVVENTDIDDFDVRYPLLRNRLGWLLEISGKHACFRPAKSKTMPLVDIGSSQANPAVIKYLKKIQTPIGRRWHVYDADITDIRGSYIGTFISTNS